MYLSGALILIFDNIFSLLLLLSSSTSIGVIAGCLSFAVELELLLEIETRCSDTDILKSVQSVTLLSRRLEYQDRLVLLERSVDVFRQCKQLLDNKSLQLVSIIESNLIDKLNTIYKRVVS